jgi:hypothetical protein
MDCKTARLLMHFAGPAELDAAEAQVLEGHLNDCPGCQAGAEAERQLDAHLGQAVRDVPVPPGLRGALLTRLASERDAFYRRWLVRAAGVAALFVLGTLVGWYFLSRPPSLTPDDILAKVQQRQEEQVNAWLARQGDVNLKGPPDFNYVLLAGYGLTEVNGRHVPTLTFVHSAGGAGRWAHVYVVSDRKFALETKDVQASGATGLHAKVLEYADRPHLVYVVVYTGGSLELFLKPQELPGEITLTEQREAPL